MSTYPIPKELVIEQALMFLPKDRDDWREKLEQAHAELRASQIVHDAAWVPAQVALAAFESCGYDYFEVKHYEWRRRLGSVAFKHWQLLRDSLPSSADGSNE